MEKVRRAAGNGLAALLTMGTAVAGADRVPGHWSLEKRNEMWALQRNSSRLMTEPRCRAEDVEELSLRKVRPVRRVWWAEADWLVDAS